MSSLFPMFLKLENKRCLVVGAGKVGEPKIAGLLDTGARVSVIALEAAEAVHAVSYTHLDVYKRQAYIGMILKES